VGILRPVILKPTVVIVPDLINGRIEVYSRISHRPIWVGKPNVEKDPRGYSQAAITLIKYIESTNPGADLGFPTWDPNPSEATFQDLRVYMVDSDKFPDTILATMFQSLERKGVIIKQTK